MEADRGPARGVLTEEQALQLVAFLASAAEITLVEPTYYGTFRLIDAASRMIGYMLENGGDLESEEFLREFKRELDTKKVWMMWDREAYYDFLRAAPGQVAGELRRRHEAEGEERGMTTADEVFALLKSRRVVRSFADEPVADEMLQRVAHAARWASSAGNRHIHKFLIVRDPERIRLVRSFAPGMLTEPPALIAVLTDFDAMRREDVRTEGDDANSVDVGTALQSMMTMAHAMGLGSCPVTSFSRSGVAGVLGLPGHLRPELILILGHPKPAERSMRSNAPKPLRARDLVYWERAGEHEPA